MRSGLNLPRPVTRDCSAKIATNHGHLSQSKSVAGAPPKTNRLNKDHWCGAYGLPINQDLNQYSENDSRAMPPRSVHQSDGRRGHSDPHNRLAWPKRPNDPSRKQQRKPTTSCLLNSGIELFGSPALVQDDQSAPLEVSGQSGFDLMARHNRQDWTDGEQCCQIIDFSEQLPGDAVVKDRLLDIDPDRLENPGRQALDNNVSLGIHRDRFGRPITYFVRNPSDQFKLHFQLTHEYEDISADDFLHIFESLEPGQARGEFHA